MRRKRVLIPCILKIVGFPLGVPNKVFLAANPLLSTQNPKKNNFSLRAMKNIFLAKAASELFFSESSQFLGYTGIFFLKILW